MVPIISEIAWERILLILFVFDFVFYFYFLSLLFCLIIKEFKSAGVAADNMLREYEHAVNMIQSVSSFAFFKTLLINNVH